MPKAYGTAINVLKALKGRRLTPEEIAVQAECPPSSVWRNLQALTAAGLVRPVGTVDTGRPGMKPFIYECVNCAPIEETR